MLTAANFSIYFVYHCSYSLYEPNHTVLREYKGGLEKAILRNSILLDELNDAFCKTHPQLAQKICTRSAHAAVRVRFVQVHCLTRHRACVENKQVNFYMMFVLLMQ